MVDWFDGDEMKNARTVGSVWQIILHKILMSKGWGEITKFVKWYLHND